MLFLLEDIPNKFGVSVRAVQRYFKIINQAIKKDFLENFKVIDEQSVRKSGRNNVLRFIPYFLNFIFDY